MKFNPTLSVESLEINNLTTVIIVTAFDNGGSIPMVAGDYIEVSFLNPYNDSRGVF